MCAKVDGYIYIRSRVHGFRGGYTNNVYDAMKWVIFLLLGLLAWVSS